MYKAVLTAFDAQGRTATDSRPIPVLPGTTASLSPAPNPAAQGSPAPFFLQATAWITATQTLVSL